MDLLKLECVICDNTLIGVITAARKQGCFAHLLQLKGHAHEKDAAIDIWIHIGALASVCALRLPKSAGAFFYRYAPLQPSQRLYLGSALQSWGYG